MAKTQQRPSLTRHWIADELRRRVIVGDLEPGEWLRQDEIATEFGTSHGPVREAFRALASEGFVQHETHRGYRVATVDVEDLQQITAIRDLLESEAIRQAVPRLTSTQLAELQAAYDHMNRLADAARSDDLRSVEEFRAAHEQFHVQLFECSGLPRLTSMVITEWRHAQRIRSIALRDHDGSAVQRDEWHDVLMDACVRRDAESAVEAMRSHRVAASEAAINALASRERQTR